MIDSSVLKNALAVVMLFSLRSTLDYFNDRGSTVFTAALDVSKAYDCVQHYKLFSALLRAGLPKNMVCLLADWYSKLCVVVRWNNSYSNIFRVGSGVRQGHLCFMYL